MTERIQKILAARGLASRRTAENWILQGRVTCNGQACTLGQSADPDVDIIRVDGKEIPSAQKYLYILLNKPKGYVTTLSDEKGRRNVSQLVADCAQRVYPVGRLDMDSEGLLLLTNDGAFANAIMHPKHNVDKVYAVIVSDFTPEKLEMLKKPIVLDGYRIRQPQVRLLRDDGETAQIRVTIHEGRNRQVRRMCAAAGMKVKRLIRVEEAGLQLGELPSGKWRFLTPKEIERLRQETV